MCVALHLGLKHYKQPEHRKHHPPDTCGLAAVFFLPLERKVEKSWPKPNLKQSLTFKGIGTFLSVINVSKTKRTCVMQLLGNAEIQNSLKENKMENFEIFAFAYLEEQGGVRSVPSAVTTTTQIKAQDNVCTVFEEFSLCSNIHWHIYLYIQQLSNMVNCWTAVVKLLLHLLSTEAGHTKLKKPRLKTPKPLSDVQHLWKMINTLNPVFLTLAA